jgi:predicted ABC-type ATPase
MIPEWQAQGYEVKLFFIRLNSPELAIARVRQRVHDGGHDIPEPTIRRRFAAGLKNLKNIYQPLVNEWAIYDNSGASTLFLTEGRQT